MDNSNTRYSLLDSLRGFAVINMIAYHFIYDLKFIFARDIGWFGNFGTYLWEQGICILFILISGICANFGRNKLRRGITLLLCGSAITVVTSLMLPNEAVHFGVLSFIGSAVLLMIPLEKLISRLNPVLGLIGSFALFALTKQIDNGFLGFFDLRLLPLPKVLYSFEFLAFLGFPSPNFRSSDYFPLIPWFFLFTFGYFLWRILKAKNADRFFTAKVPFFNAVGKHSLIIYIVHQPVIYGVLYLVFQTGLFG
ncbi:MAG: heparan-alpha-glucosaminide N-acetyltransferase [Ruminococcus sp.]|nr:heparan-alpha-glucosaminide N-acetyltransferase [Ruminococcus sp.]